MSFEEDFANFLYRLNQRLSGGKIDDGFYKESFVSYLEENATLVAKRDFKMNEIKPGCVYIQYFKSGITNSSMDSIRILTTPRNPVYIGLFGWSPSSPFTPSDAMGYSNTKIPIYIASSLEMHRGWPQNLTQRKDLDEYLRKKTKYTVFNFSSNYVPIQKDNMSLMYTDSNGYLKWNGWNTTDLEVWELPASVLTVVVPSLNYPEGGF